jgi:hypothetical protein
MRRAARVDDNQAKIVEGLRGLGATVRSTAAIGEGFPDIAVGFRGKNWFFEIKDGSKPPSGRKLTEFEVLFHDDWRGQADVIESLDDALRVMGVL